MYFSKTWFYNIIWNLRLHFYHDFAKLEFTHFQKLKKINIKYFANPNRDNSLLNIPNDFNVVIFNGKFYYVYGHIC